MFRTIVEKEVRGIITSPLFATTFSVCGLLILLSIAVGVAEHRAFEARQTAAEGLVREELAEAESWSEIRPKAFREADPLQVFVAGVHNDVGRYSAIREGEDVVLRRGVYADEPALAVFRMLDLAFIVTVVLSLLAILFTYDAVSGEREGGTLRLVLANPVPRAQYILGKFAGLWLGLVLPLTLPLLIGFLGVALAGVSLGEEDWLRLFLLVLASVLYFTVFLAFGLAVSVRARRSSTAFLVLLAAWVVVVLVVPRASLTAATHMRPVPSVSEIAGRRAAFENGRWAKHRDELLEAWEQRSAAMEGMSDRQREGYEDEHLWQWMEDDDRRRREVEAEIADYGMRQHEELCTREAAQARLALALARPSPAAAFNLVASALVGTDYTLKDRTEQAMRRYRDHFVAFVEARAGENNSGRRIVARRGGGHSNIRFTADDEAPVDLTEMPIFRMSSPSAASAAAAVIPDLGLLAGMVLLGFSVAFVSFLRAEVA